MNEILKKTDAIKKDRSPSSPSVSLAEAIEQVKKLYNKAGKAKVSPEVAVTAIGYAGISGASLTALAVLRSYGLIDRERGEDIGVSAAAVKLLHPVDEAQAEDTRRELALRPQVFNELYSAGFHQPDQEVLANHLVQKGFAADRARKVAAAYCANFDFAKLAEARNVTANVPSTEDKITNGKSQTTPKEPPDETNVLATYSIPLGANEATLVFRGDGELSPDDFVALSEYVALFKKQLERKIKSAPAKAAPIVTVKPGEEE